jgi:hypothetical protein
MKIFKIAFIATLAISFCSFAFNSKTEKEDGKEQLYKDFLSKFELVKLPKHLVLKPLTESLQKATLETEPVLEHKNKDKGRVLGAKYAAFIPEIEEGMMSRMGPSTIEAEAMLATNSKDYNALIYSSSYSYGFNSKSYFLATFDKNGAPLHSQYLGHANGQGKLDLTVSADMKLLVKELEQGTNNPTELVAGRSTELVVNNKGEIVVKNEPKQQEAIKIKKTPATKSQKEFVVG